MLSSKGFGTDLPLVNSQVEEHNIFHNEVMAIGPHMAKEGNKVSSPAPLSLLPHGVGPIPSHLTKAMAAHHPSCCSLDQVEWLPRPTPKPEVERRTPTLNFTTRQMP